MLLSLYAYAEGSVEHIEIGGYDFSLITETYDIYDSKGKVLKLYYEARNNDLLHRLSFTLHDETGSCSAKSIEEGAYEIEGNTITLYTFFDRRGRIYDVPYGARITKYKVQKGGVLKMVDSRLYIETAKKEFDRESAMRFLWETPKTDEQKAAFAAYVAEVERIYKGRFLFNEDARTLLEEVKHALDRKMAKRWR